MSRLEKQTVEQIYGSDTELHRLALRILELHPQAETMQESGCLYMAQISLATGAYALPSELGEIQVWEENGELIFMLGFAYHQRVMDSRGGGVWWPTAREMTRAEHSQYKVLGGDIGFICGLIRSQDIEWLKSLGLHNADSIDNVKYVGTAVVTAEEMSQKKPPIARTWASVGMRRASKDAMSKAFGTSIQPMVVSQLEPNSPKQELRVEKREQSIEPSGAEVDSWFSYG